MPLTISRPASSASTSERHPARRRCTPPVFATPMTSRARPCAQRLAGRQPRQARGDRRPLARPLADAALGRPVAQPECGLGISPARWYRRGTADRDRAVPGRSRAWNRQLVMRCAHWRLHRDASVQMLFEVKVGRLEELHPRCVASQVVNLIGQHHFIVIDVMRPQRFDELGGLLDRNVAVVVGMNDEHRGFRNCRSWQWARIRWRRAPPRRYRSGDSDRAEECRPIVESGVIYARRQRIGGARQTERSHQTAIAATPDAEALGSTSWRPCR